MLIRPSLFVLIAGMMVLTDGLVGQEPKKPDTKPDEKKIETKFKGVLPQNWGKIGLDDKQKQEIYKIQSKYNDEIDKLEAKIKDLKGTRDKEMKAVLTKEQKEKLDAILTGKDK